jgi:hypothetical protein
MTTHLRSFMPPSPLSAATVAPTLVPLDLGHFFDAVRQATEAAQGRQQGLGVEAERGAKRQCGHGIRGVVQAGQRQFGERQEDTLALHQAGLRHAILAQTEIFRAGRRIEAEADDAVAGPRHALTRASSRFSTCTQGAVGSPLRKIAVLAPA